MEGENRTLTAHAGKAAGADQKRCPSAPLVVLVLESPRFQGRGFQTLQQWQSSVRAGHISGVVLQSIE